MRDMKILLKNPLCIKKFDFKMLPLECAIHYRIGTTNQSHSKIQCHFRSKITVYPHNTKLYNFSHLLQEVQKKIKHGKRNIAVRMYKRMRAKRNATILKKELNNSATSRVARMSTSKDTTVSGARAQEKRKETT
jgi:hypothetical protein